MRKKYKNVTVIPNVFTDVQLYKQDVMKCADILVYLKNQILLKYIINVLQYVKLMQVNVLMHAKIKLVLIIVTILSKDV